MSDLMVSVSLHGTGGDSCPVSNPGGMGLRAGMGWCWPAELCLQGALT